MIKLNPVEITATSQTYAVEFVEKLCKPFCENSSIQPSITGTLQVDDVTLVGTTEYVRIKAQGTITYVPQNGNACNPCSKVVTEYFTVAFANVATEQVPTVDVELGYTRPAFVNCYGVACGIALTGLVTVKIPA